MVFDDWAVDGEGVARLNVCLMSVLWARGTLACAGGGGGGGWSPEGGGGGLAMGLLLQNPW